MPERPIYHYSEQYLAESAARAASGDSGAFTGYGVASTLRVQLDVTAFTVAAGNTLDVVLEDSLDGSTWNPIATFAQKTGAGREVLDVISPFADRLRVRWTVGGTPNPTFSVLAVSQVPEVA
jgi:hypothetical protein